MKKLTKKFKKVVILDTVVFYPEHRRLLETLTEEICEFPSSLPESLERQYVEQPELFKNVKCYTELGTNDAPSQLLQNRIEGADVVISCWTSIPDEVLRLNPQLKLVIFWTHEKEHRINVPLAEKMGIRVENIPDYGTDAVAEVVFAGLMELLARRYPTKKETVSTAILREVFRRMRKLDVNEKNTRSGKFSHHFHKLGMVSFDFSKESIEALIPEHLVERKQIGLFNTHLSKEVKDVLRAFNISVLSYAVGDSNLAQYYKTIAESDLIFFDSSKLSSQEQEKLIRIVGDKAVDVLSLTGFDYVFTGKRFGLVGLGRIGAKVAYFATRLGFEVVYFSKARKLDLEKELGVSFVALEELMETSDVVSVHVSAHKAEGIIDAALIQKMKFGACFINTADGNAINQEALTKRMLNNEISAYLDVYPGLPRKDIMGIPMDDPSDWKIKQQLPMHVIAYRAGWKTQESIRIKTYKMLGQMFGLLLPPAS